MVTPSAEPVFVDTNILVYANLALSPYHDLAIRRLQALDAADVELWISRQVLREYLAGMTRPGTLTGTIPLSSLVADVRSFAARFHMAEDGGAVTVRLLDLLIEVPAAGAPVHDANIVATMQVAGVRRLLTHNGDDFRRYEPAITVLPLEEEDAR